MPKTVTATKTLSFDFSPPDGIIDNVDQWITTTDQNGNILSYIRRNDYGADGDWNWTDQTVNTYKHGVITKSVSQSDINGDEVWDNNSITKFNYEKIKGDYYLTGEHQERDYDLNGIIDFRYDVTIENDSKGNMIDKLYTVDMDADGTVDITNHYTYSYDNQGRILQEVFDNDDAQTEAGGDYVIDYVYS